MFQAFAEGLEIAGGLRSQMSQTRADAAMDKAIEAEVARLRAENAKRKEAFNASFR
jgi:hypothetical protein